MQPITIKHGTFTAQIYDVSYLMDLSWVKLRRLWKLMFETTSENSDAIDTIRAWLPTIIANTEKAIHKEQDVYKPIAAEAESARRTVAVFGSMVTKEQQTSFKNAAKRVQLAEKHIKIAKARHDRANKIQTVFNEMIKK